MTAQNEGQTANGVTAREGLSIFTRFDGAAFGSPLMTVAMLPVSG
jgi:hypothetical protein